MIILVILRDRNLGTAWFQFVRFDDTKHVSRNGKIKAEDFF